jgi:acyl-coenzyme A synthetase/AMP-(fatty) acid ligase
VGPARRQYDAARRGQPLEASINEAKRCRFVEQFPQTASGKIQKYVLREQYLAGKT